MLINYLRQRKNEGASIQPPKDYYQFIQYLIEILFFTTPGEIDREPTFGIGIYRYIFGKLNDTTLEIIRADIEKSMHKWLREFFELTNVEVNRDNEKLEIMITYKVKKTKTIEIYVLQKELE